MYNVFLALPCNWCRSDEILFSPSLSIYSISIPSLYHNVYTLTVVESQKSAGNRITQFPSTFCIRIKKATTTTNTYTHMATVEHETRKKEQRLKLLKHLYRTYFYLFLAKVIAENRSHCWMSIIQYAKIKWKNVIQRFLSFDYSHLASSMKFIRIFVFFNIVPFNKSKFGV